MSEDPRVSRTRRDVTAVALRILLEQGWGSVTHSVVAQESGYSRGTIYQHWPTQIDLVRDAFKQYEEMPHAQKTGCVQGDLTAELRSFIDAMVKHKLDRALAMLSEKAQTSPEVVDIRDSFVAAGEKPIREIITPLYTSEEVEALTLMLCGMVTHSVLMHGSQPSLAVVDRAVDIVLSGVAVKV